MRILVYVNVVWMTAYSLVGCSMDLSMNEDSVEAHKHSAYSDLCHFDFSAEAIPAAKTLAGNGWAKDRYDEGLVIQWDIRHEKLRSYPVIGQSLELVSDTLYAMILPTKTIDTLIVSVDVGDLSDGDYGWTTAKGGGDYYRSGAIRGLPISGKVGIVIDDYELDDNYDKPLYLSSLAHWYMLFLHETFHVLGFGTSPKWDDMITTRRWDDFICRQEVFKGHWYSPSYDGPGRALMFSYLSSSKVLIHEAMPCVLEGIGWRLRKGGE